MYVRACRCSQRLTIAAVVGADAEFSPPGRPEDRAGLAERAVSAHRDEWLAWLMAADSATAERAKRKALARGLQTLAPAEVADAMTRAWDGLRQACAEAARRALPTADAPPAP
jgi:hypothetical protein